MYWAQNGPNAVHENNSTAIPVKPDSEKNNIKPSGDSQGSLKVQREKSAVIISCPLLSEKGNNRNLWKVKHDLSITCRTI